MRKLPFASKYYQLNNVQNVFGNKNIAHSCRKYAEKAIESRCFRFNNDFLSNDICNGLTELRE